MAAYYSAHRDSIAKRKAAYYAANRDRLVKRQATYFAANRERYTAYYAANREKYAAYYAANRDRIRKRQAAYREAKRLSRAKIKRHQRTMRVSLGAGARLAASRSGIADGKGDAKGTNSHFDLRRRLPAEDLTTVRECGHLGTGNNGQKPDSEFLYHKFRFTTNIITC
jgi:hypothetical protein